VVWGVVVRGGHAEIMNKTVSHHKNASPRKVWCEPLGRSRVAAIDRSSLPAVASFDQRESREPSLKQEILAKVVLV
jgi:hypothetical protein